MTQTDPAVQSRTRRRLVKAGDGREWLVEERVSSRGEGNDATHQLVATWSNLTRHARRYPTAWYDLSDTKLLAILADPAHAR